MPKKESTPRFINSQSSPVRVFGEDKRPVSVGCFNQRFQQSDGCFVLEGHYWKRFLHPNGPLAVYPPEDRQGFTNEMCRRDTNAQRAVDEGQAPDSFRAPTDDDGSDEEATTPNSGEASKPDPETPVTPASGTEAGTVGEEGQDGPDGPGDDADSDETDPTDESSDADDDSDEEEEEDSDDDGEEIELTMAQLRGMKKDELIALAKANGVPHGGTVSDLKTRLETHFFSDEPEEE